MFTVLRNPAVLREDRCTTHNKHCPRGQQNTCMYNPALPLKQTEEHRPLLFAGTPALSSTDTFIFATKCSWFLLKINCCSVEQRTQIAVIASVMLSERERTQFSSAQSFLFIPYLACLSPLFSPSLGFSFCSQNFYDSSAFFSCSRLVWQPAKWKGLIRALSFKTGFMSNCSFQQAQEQQDISVTLCARIW